MVGKYLFSVLILIPFFAIPSNMQIYNPALFNLSVLYDFDPVKGNVKELHTTVYNNDKSIVYEVNIKLDSDGCIESFRSRKPKDEVFIILDKQSNELKGKDKYGEVSIKLDDNCSFLSKKDSTGVVLYEYNANGYIKDMISEYTGKVIGEYTYKKNGLLENVKFFINKDIITESSIMYADPKKPLDSEMIYKMYGEIVATVKTKCQYNNRDVAYSCEIINFLATKEKPIIEYQQAITEASFY